MSLQVIALGVMYALVAPAAVPPAPPPMTPSGRVLADTSAAVRWNLLALSLIEHDGAAGRRADSLAATGDSLARVALDAAGPSPNPRRLAALLGAAQYRAALDASRDGASVRAAVAAASAALLADLFRSPECDAAVWRAFAADVLAARRQDGRTAADRGEALGRMCATRVAAHARTDRSDAAWTGTVPVGAGRWTSAPGQAPRGAAMPGWRPWLLDSAAQVRPPPPPDLDSPTFAAALAEVRQIARDRTPEQTAIARRWANEPVTERFVADEIVRHGLSEAEAARVYGLFAVASWDAFIACWDAKYTYWLLRPYQADTTVGEVAGVGHPNHPSYPSGHACGSGVAETMLTALFPDDAPAIAAITDEGRMSRLYGSVHYRFDNDAGRALGRAVAERALAAERDGRLLRVALGPEPPGSP
ncbi:MAG TPA: vanadium-dependent haloperoxidase [Rubricoccaceae bacterium]